MQNTLPALLLALLFTGNATAGNKQKGTFDSSSVPPYYRYSLHTQHYFSLLTGFNFSKNDAEVGLGYSIRRRHKFNASGSVLYVADEISLHNATVMGPKVGLWVGNGLAAGVAFIYYTDFVDGRDARIRPEIGFGQNNARITYGYNIPTGNRLPYVSEHIVTLTANWKLARVSDKMVERDWDSRGRKDYMEGRGDTTFSKHSTMVLAGVNGWNYLFGDLGIGMCADETVTKRKNKIAVVVFAGGEIKLSNGTLLAPKAGVYAYGRGRVGLCGGASFLYYTGMGQQSLVIRPEAGIHIGTSRVVYGYNHILAGYSFDALSQHNISAIMGLRIGRFRNEFALDKKETGF